MRNWLVLVALAASFAGCSAHFPDAPSSTPTLAAIRVHYSNPHTTLNPGNSLSLAVYTVNSDGVYQLLPNNAASWFSTNAGVATVTNGSVRGVGHGDTDIVAGYQGHTSVARVVVQETPVRYPRLDFRSVSPIEAGSPWVVAALLFETANSNRDVTSVASWSSSDPRVFSVESGQVKAVGPGTGALTASFNGVAATVFASVPPLRKLP